MTTAILKRAPIGRKKLISIVRELHGMHALSTSARLGFQKDKASAILKKLIQSAVANAENNHNSDPYTLMIEKIDVGPATQLKRFMARGRGRGARILMHYSNIKVTLKSVS